MPQPNNHKISTQHFAVCCACLVTLLQCVECCYFKFNHFQTWANNAQCVATGWPDATLRYVTLKCGDNLAGRLLFLLRPAVIEKYLQRRVSLLIFFSFPVASCHLTKYTAFCLQAVLRTRELLRYGHQHSAETWGCWELSLVSWNSSRHTKHNSLKKWWGMQRNRLYNVLHRWAMVILCLE